MPAETIDLKKLKEQIRRIPQDQRPDKLEKLLKCIEAFCAEQANLADGKEGMFGTFHWH
jgi:hypothetical protein